MSDEGRLVRRNGHRYPEVFVANVVFYGDGAGERWLRRLPRLVAAGAEHWGLVAPQPLAGLSFNYLVKGRLKAPRDRLRTAVAKFIWDDDALASEVAWLRLQQGNSVVRLLDTSERLGAYLMEELRPGEPLPTHDDEFATEVIGTLIAALSGRVPDAALPRVTTWFEGMYYIEVPEALGSPSPECERAVVERAKGVANALALPAGDERLLHGDLHHGNVLSAEGGWKVIDAKGVVGDPAHECAAMLRNGLDGVSAEHLPRLLRARVSILADVTGFDAKRIAGWGFAQTVLACWWNTPAGQHRDVARGLAVADVLKSMF